MHDILRFDSVDLSCACMAGVVDLLTVVPHNDLVPYGISFLRQYKNPCNKERQANWDVFWEQWLHFLDSWKVYELDGILKEIMDRDNNATER